MIVILAIIGGLCWFAFSTDSSEYADAEHLYPSKNTQENYEIVGDMVHSPKSTVSSKLENKLFDDKISKIVNTSKDTIQDIVKKSKENRQITCIAQNIYHESRGQPYSGRIAVGMVTMNRSAISKLPPCKVVFAQNSRGCQFTWTCDRNNLKPIWKSPAWNESLVIAYLSYHRLVSDVTSGATYYFNPSKVKTPKWAYAEIPVNNQYIRNGYLGDHRFFKPGANDIYAQN